MGDFLLCKYMILSMIMKGMWNSYLTFTDVLKRWVLSFLRMRNLLMYKMGFKIKKFSFHTFFPGNYICLWINVLHVSLFRWEIAKLTFRIFLKKKRGLLRMMMMFLKGGRLDVMYADLKAVFRALPCHHYSCKTSPRRRGVRMVPWSLFDDIKWGLP